MRINKITRKSKTPHIISAAIIIGLAGGLGFYLVQNRSAGNLTETKKPAQDKKNEAGVAFTEKLASESLSSLSQTNVAKNFTEKFSGVLFSRIQNEGFGDSPDALDAVMTSRRISGPALNEFLQDKKTNLDLYAPAAGLKTSADNSDETKKQYLKETAAVISRDFSGFNKIFYAVLMDAFDKNDPSSALQLADIYSKLADDFLAIVAPSDFASLHQTMVTHYRNGAKVYRAIADHQNDPVKGYLALQAVDNLLSDAKQIQMMINKNAEKLHLLP
ncbi:MAG: hypothetical protein HZA37_00205 [Parcubacteria group bacterium]|nr:hypothetical protein [Parcubacteria group bacterium]